MSAFYELCSLFAVSLLAASIFPAQSELFLAGLSMAGKHPPLLLVGVATLGNVLGACINWLLGYYLVRFKDRKWFPVKEHMIAKVSGFYQKWGVWTLLLSWVPIVGDPLTLVAGIFRTHIILFLTLVTLGKAARYAVIVALI
jgi:membrane protein YqaA with SNARE-associated domain